MPTHDAPVSRSSGPSDPAPGDPGSPGDPGGGPVETGGAPDRFAWHPEPGLFDFFAPDARARLDALGRATWEATLDYLYDQALIRPVGPDSYRELRERFFGPSRAPGPAPKGPARSDEVLAEVRARVAPYLYNAYHPRSFAYFTPPPLPLSVAGEVLSQWFHQGVDVFHSGPAAALVEEEVTGWLVDLVGAGDDGWGVLTSGGVMANLMAMTVARDRWLPTVLGTTALGTTLAEPPRGGALERARVYASDQAHFSIARALDMLGFPEQALRVVPSDDRFRLRAGPVAEAVAEDRAAGLLPFCIAAVAGSTNTGSVDEVPALAELAGREGLWLHVDAAYGGAVRLSARDAGRVPGLELADSVTVDPHKWLFQAYDIGALVVRRRGDLHQTFHRAPEYYRSAVPETAPLNWLEYSMEGTRRFRALKLWTSWKHVGTDGFARLVEHGNDVAAVLARAVADSEDFQGAVEVPELSIVCLRHLPGPHAACDGATGHAHPGDAAHDAALDAHQDRLQRALEISGEGWVSTTKLRGRTYLRAGVMNWLTTADDARALLDLLRRLAATLT